MQQGRLSDAGELARLVLEMSKAALGPDHLQTSFDTWNLGNIYIQQWRLKEAEELYTTAFEITKRLVGPEHPYTGSCMQQLATTWTYQGRRKQAVAMMTEYAQLMNESYGSENASTKWAFGVLEDWSSPRQATPMVQFVVRFLLTIDSNLKSFLRNHWSGIRRTEMMRRRRSKYPKVKVHGAVSCCATAERRFCDSGCQRSIGRVACGQARNRRCDFGRKPDKKFAYTHSSVDHAFTLISRPSIRVRTIRTMAGSDAFHMSHSYMTREKIAQGERLNQFTLVLKHTLSKTGSGNLTETPPDFVTWSTPSLLVRISVRDRDPRQ